MIRDFRASRHERMVSSVRYYKHMIPDIIAGLASIGLLLIVVMIMVACG